MAESMLSALAEDVIEGVAHGEVAASVDAFSIDRDDDNAIKVDLGQPDVIYIISVTSVQRRP